MKRWKTREVLVGSVGIGGSNPIRIQSMTTSDTRDVQATLEQAMRLADAGCDIVRVTVQGKKEAESCGLIKEGLVKKGYTIPLVADIHFYPPAALMVADFADKVRINPGNFADKRASFAVTHYDDVSYALEIEKIEEKFAPLVEKCKRLKKAIRIGTNHGSLSDRIMNRYGDSPAGMVESAFEFARICRKYDFHDFLFSMKSSNTAVMIAAYRLLVSQMEQMGWDYPLHLGVTEAGEGEDGRVKSAIGIGSLLLDGIGDTLRVSLTEDPWYEVDPCLRLVKLSEEKAKLCTPPFSPKPRNRIITAPLHRDGSVIIELKSSDLESKTLLQDLGFSLQLGKAIRNGSTADAVVAEQVIELPQLQAKKVTEDPSTWQELLEKRPSSILYSPSQNFISNTRSFFAWLQEQQLKIPVILNFAYSGDEADIVIQAAAEFGSLLCDGLGDGICISAPLTVEQKRSLSFSILQGARMRASKTEFISCPGCGRTLFNLQEVAGKIRGRTAHLPGVKIAIMGCIVNGPGEMADADFGYVGSLPGKIDLYVGKERVEKNIPMEEAEDRLVDLIKRHGRWLEPELTLCK